MTTSSAIETMVALASETVSNFSDVTGNEMINSFNMTDINDTMMTLATTTKSPYGKFGLLESFPLFWVVLGINKYYLYVVIALGFPGNIASCLTVLRMPPVTSTSMYIVGLALTDNLAITIKVLINVLFLYLVNLHDAGCKLLLYLGNVSVIYANWVLVAMTVERFFAVWFPLRMATIGTKKNAGRILVGLAILISLFCSWYLIVLHSVYFSNRAWRCVLHSQYTTFANEYWHIIYAAIHSLIPSVILIVLNVLITVGLMRSSRVLQKMSSNKSDKIEEKTRQQRQITIMLTTISVAFVLLNLPNCIFYIVKPYWKFVRMSYEHVVFLFLFQFIHLLTDATHAINFYLYFLSAGKFRTRFVEMVKCCKTKARHVSTHSSTWHTNLPASEPCDIKSD